MGGRSFRTVVLNCHHYGTTELKKKGISNTCRGFQAAHYLSECAGTDFICEAKTPFVTVSSATAAVRM